jgi:hypothetical protein
MAQHFRLTLRGGGGIVAGQGDHALGRRDMACSSEGYPETPPNINGLKLNQLGALACAAFKFLAKRGLVSEFLEEQQQHSGVSSLDANMWWTKHLAEDELKRKKEVMARVKRELAEQAAAKLTAEERRALGLE